MGFPAVEWTPDFLEKNPMSQHFAGVTHQSRKQLVLLGRQMNLPILDENSPKAEVDLEVARREGRRVRVAA